MKTRLITPPPEREEIYPYRRVWRSLIIEMGLLLLIVGALYGGALFLNLRIPQVLQSIANPGLVMLPMLLWLGFSWFAERFAPQPRNGLFGVLLLSALAANAVGVPLVSSFYRVNDWLPLSSAVDRIIGYTFTAGMVQELLKYLVLRYTIWRTELRTWQDAAAYGIASGLGYALVLNLHYIGNGTLPTEIVGLRSFEMLVLNIVGGLIVSYGLAISRFNPDSFLLTPVTLLGAALVSGVAIPIRAGLVNASLSVEGVSTAQPVLGLGLAVAILVSGSALLAFAYDYADRRQIEQALALEE